MGSERSPQASIHLDLKEIYSEEQQAVGTHKGEAGEGGLIYGGARRIKTTAVFEGERSPCKGREEAGEGTGAGAQRGEVAVSRTGAAQRGSRTRAGAG